MKNIILATLMASTPLTAQAIDYRVSGFGSIIGGATTDKENFTPHIKYGNGFYDQSVDLSTETRFGIQLTAQFNEQFSATAQVISRGAMDWKPEMPWAYVNYQATDSLQIKVGQMNAPYYLFSDYQDVGYALPWVNAPENTYMVPTNIYKGINVSYSFYTGDIDHVVEAFIGKVEDSQEGFHADDLDTDVDAFGINITSTYNWLTTRLSYNEGYIDMNNSELQALNDGLIAVAADPKMIRRTSLTDQRASFIGLAVRADFDKVFVIAEVNQLDWTTGLFATQNRAYVSSGYRVTEKLTPYITLMKNMDNDAKIIPTGNATLDAGLNAIATGSTAKGWAIGTRYDLVSDIAIKAEYSSFDVDGSSNDTNTFRIGVDFLF